VAQLVDSGGYRRFYLGFVGYVGYQANAVFAGLLAELIGLA